MIDLKAVNHMRTFEHEKRLTAEAIKSMDYKTAESKVECQFWDGNANTRRGTMKNETKKYWYAWVGQNATTGTPNQLTGGLNRYGNNYKFKSKRERDEFVYDYCDPNGNNHAVKCSRRKLRQYNLGCSVADYEENLQHMDCTIYDDEQERWIS